MINEAHVVIDQLSHLPNGLEHPLVALAAANVAIFGSLGASEAYKRTQREHGEEIPNPGMRNITIIDSIDKRPSFPTRIKRMGAAITTFVGLTVGLGSLAAQPTFESHATSNDALAVVVDGSYSMTLTHDVGNHGESRLDAVVAGLRDAHFPGRVAAVEFGADAKVSVPLGSEWKSGLDALKKQPVDPNGGALIPAINVAASLLPSEAQATKNGETKPVKTVAVITDGTVENSPEQLAQEAAKLQKAGVELKAVVTGTPNASYKIDGSDPIPSGTQPNQFVAFGKQNVAEAQTATQIKNEINSALESSGHETSTKKPWDVVTWLGFAAAAAGSVRMLFKRARKMV